MKNQNWLDSLWRYIAPGLFLYTVAEVISILFYCVKDDKITDEIEYDEKTDEVSIVYKKSGKVVKVIPRDIKDIKESFPTVGDKLRKILNKVEVAKVIESKKDKGYVIVVYDNGVIVKLKPEKKG